MGWKLMGLMIIALAIAMPALGCGDDDSDDTETVTVTSPPASGGVTVETPVVVPDSPAPAADEGDAAADTMPTVINTTDTIGPCIDGQQEVTHVTEYSDGTAASSISMQPCEAADGIEVLP